MMALALPLLALPASAATPPPWEPDPNALGTLTFYNSTGQVISGGNNLAHLFDYLEASSADSTGGTKAEMQFTQPVPSTPTGNFPASPLSLATAFPNATAPAPLNSTADPVDSLSSTDADLANFIASRDRANRGRVRQHVPDPAAHHRSRAAWAQPTRSASTGTRMSW